MKATPDELKYYASICKKGNCSSQCPYNDYERCVETMMIDALAYIKQLEAEREGKSDE
ncbi:hypothetical protein [Hominenteromicrobium sp.]|uniref:hypothetical protein n=1 Tax=Hominenteromicrobium sp. TaxID=3073581 RepID=UPI003A94DCB4